MEVSRLIEVRYGMVVFLFLFFWKAASVHGRQNVEIRMACVIAINLREKKIKFGQFLTNFMIVFD